MDAHKLISIKTPFVIIKMGSFIVSFSKNMVLLFFTYIFSLFGFIRHCVSRFRKKFITRKKNLSNGLIQSPENNPTNENVIESENNESLVEENYSESSLLFHFPTYEEVIKNNGESFKVLSMEDKVFKEHSSDELKNVKATENVPIVCSTGDDSVQSKEIFVAQTGSKTENPVIETDKKLRESRVDNEEKTRQIGEKQFDDGIIITEENNAQFSSETEVSRRFPIYDFFGSDFGENSKGISFQNEEKLNNLVNNSIQKSHQFLSDEDESLVSDSDSDSLVSSFRSSFADSISDGFLFDMDFEKAFEVDTLKEEDIELQKLKQGYESGDFEDEEEILDELKKLKESNNNNNNNVKLEQENESKVENKQEDKQFGEKSNSGEQLSSDSDEQNGLEREWEHQDLLEQLKMEIKKVRSIGLPTILEESDSPKIAEDLKPWKIEDKFQYEDTFDELHKFYKSYRERMRKLDILNYQKMYAIGFLRVKDPLQSFGRHKISTQTITSVVSLDCWPCKSKSATEIEQPVMKKFSRELESELEMVYVGQMCLSWEFLHWEYGKALDLWDSDPHGIRYYNEVAEKFQQFQVLITRFIEDERFRGPRVQHYVKTRCVLRNLLQVPLIREDNTRDKKKGRMIFNPKDGITSVKLVEIIEESIRVFWKFIRADKDTTNTLLLKCRRSSNVELLNPSDAKLLPQLRSSLQKREKKLKELTKSENCILRKFQTTQEEDSSSSDHVQYFFCEVDLRLVQRVLNMSTVSTEQLGWCRDKLSNIKFEGKKLLLHPSVLLFPCP